jgi:hypothetical protein
MDNITTILRHLFFMYKNTKYTYPNNYKVKKYNNTNTNTNNTNNTNNTSNFIIASRFNTIYNKYNLSKFR